MDSVKRWDIEEKDLPDPSCVQEMMIYKEGEYVLYTDYVGAIADRDFRIEALEKQRNELWLILDELVELKSYKDEFGKTEQYLEQQPKAWDKARVAINAEGAE